MIDFRKFFSALVVKLHKLQEMGYTKVTDFLGCSRALLF